MKKALFFLVVILLLNLDTADPCKNAEAKGVADCEKLDAGEGFYKCCYYEGDWEYMGEKGTEKGCESITKDNYDNIKDYIKKLENGELDEDEDDDGGELDISIDCGSNYIIIPMLSLILLFF